MRVARTHARGKSRKTQTFFLSALLHFVRVARLFWVKHVETFGFA
jgi:hypothetical protein